MTQNLENAVSIGRCTTHDAGQEKPLSRCRTQCLVRDTRDVTWENDVWKNVDTLILESPDPVVKILSIMVRIRDGVAVKFVVVMQIKAKDVTYTFTGRLLLLIRVCLLCDVFFFSCNNRLLECGRFFM